ncbi:MAG: diguanylate cyclase [Acidimicrobiales bacterium]|nr:diguanylate cyclase [Acidimicrobiales bacterium]
MGETSGTEEDWALQILGRLADVVFVLSLDGGVEWRRELGRDVIGTPDHLVEGGRMLDRIHPDDMGIALAAFDDLAAGRSQQTEIEVRIRYADRDEWMLGRVRGIRLSDSRIAGLTRIIDTAVDVDLTSPNAPGFSIADVTPIGIAVLSRGDLVAYTNESFRETTKLEIGFLPEGDETAGAIAAAAAGAREHGKERLEISDRGHDLVIGAHRIGSEGREEVLVTVQDVTELTALRAAQRTADRLFSTAFEHAPTGMALVGLDNRFLRVNPAFAEITGYSVEELLEVEFEAITHPDDLGDDLALVRQIIGGEVRSYRLEKRYLHKEGHPVWAELRVAGAYDDAGTLTNFISQITDITSRKLIEEQQRLNTAVLLHRSTHDPLTDLPNRALLDEHLRLLIARVRREADTGAILYCDLDDFKAINDAHGHLVGDRVLIEVASRLRHLVRETDLVARVGGDEFVIALASAEHREGVAEVAERIHTAISEPIRDPEIGPVEVGSSIGVVLIEATDDPMAALHRADSAAYEAKRAGGGIRHAG